MSIDYSKDNNSYKKFDPEQSGICVVCVKYGTKYGADYVNKLHAGIKRHLSLEHTFACFTEDATDLHKDIKVLPLNDKNQEWSGWWSKVNIFDGNNYSDLMTKERMLVLYIDLDMIISGNIDDLVHNFAGKFATLTTNDIFCEQTQDGYNSSVMLFNVQDNES